MMMAASVREKFRLRPAAFEDTEAVTALLNAHSMAAIGAIENTVEDVRQEWQSPGFDLERSSLMVETLDGRLIGYADVFDTNPIPVRIFFLVAVHPDFAADPEIGATLMQWAETRARQALARVPQDARVVMQAGVSHTYQPDHLLYQAHRLSHVRSFYDMKIDMDAAPPLPVWPDGITVRPMRVNEEERAVVQAVQDSFKDHYGFVEQPFEEVYIRWQHRMQSPDYDPSLWFVALDGDQIAGISLCWPKSDDDPDMGWVGSLGVLRPWRRKGLALALLQHSFIEFWQRGKRKVGLGVDASSLTGALRLYEKAGMSPYRQFDLYEKELRPGVELMTQSVED